MANAALRSVVAALLIAGGGVAIFQAVSGDEKAQAPPPEPPLRYDTEYPTIGYSTARPTDPVAQLAAKIERGETKLEFTTPRGYLDSLLAALEIDPSSQTLVFSATSAQARRITPAAPRAIYFNDDVYVAWVQGGPLELGSMDPNLGPVFYVVEQTPDAPAQFEQERASCLSCHDSYSMTGGGVPRFIVGSGYTGTTGDLVSHEGWILVTDRTPLKSRWGGWYTTGQHGDQVSLGNMVIRSYDDFQRLEELRVNNIDTLDGLFDTTPYLTNKSDIVALLVFEHQVNMQNAIARLSWDARTPGAAAAAAESLEALVETAFFAHSVQLTSPITGEPRFVEQFLARAVRDDRGRSLRELDMTTRMFRYPLSYVIYSAAFDALPKDTKDRVYGRFAQVLRGEDASEAYAHLTPDDRSAILEILTATKPDFVAAIGD